jgi:DNA polymerase V
MHSWICLLQPNLMHETIDKIRERFGKDVIFKAHSLMSGGTFLDRAGHVDGHKGASD